jgi:hypothetical protein
MSRILKRPMFRRGGTAGEGIMSGITDRKNYNIGGIDREMLRTDAEAIQSLLNEFAPVPKTRLPIGDYGINLALGMDPVEALRDPYAKFTKADDIRRAQLAKRGQGAVSTALNLQLAKLKQKPVIKARTLSDKEVKEKGFPAGSIVQEKGDGTLNVVNKPTAKEIQQRADLTGTVGLLNRIELNYKKAGKPVGKFYNIDPDRIMGEIGKFTGSEQGKTFAELQADIKKATTFLTKAISGAQVSDKEREFIEKLIPSIGDTEVEFEAKLKSLRRYLGEAVKSYGGDVEALMRAGDLDESISAKNFLPTRQKNLEDMSDEELKAYRDSLLNEG